LEAAERDDAPGWKAVALYFPANESAVNRSYASKASLQLARLYLSQNRPRQAESILIDLLNDPATDEKFRLIARARNVQAAQLIGVPEKIAESKRQLKAAYGELESGNSEAISLFNRVFSRREQVSIGVTPAVDE
jgi:thioredoxin-like negative regulator of GroEL